MTTVAALLFGGIAPAVIIPLLWLAASLFGKIIKQRWP